jgi:6-phosphofructokinase 1
MNTCISSKLAAAAGLDFSIPTLGTPVLPSPVRHAEFTEDDRGVAYFSDTRVLAELAAAGKPVPAFEAAGPRATIFHDPAWTRAAIVTCGGLCPGLNNVIKTIVNTLYFQYGVDNVFGIKYGYRGLIPAFKLEPVHLDPDTVDTIHDDGGSMLGSSRGNQDVEEMVRTLDRLRINILFCIGGDGTLRGATAIAKAARAKKLPISVVGVPKTIDNDIDFTDRTFGFETAVHATGPIITCAHMESKGAYNGISLVRVMGRDSGFIAANASLANPVVNYCLVPEVPFELEGPDGFLASLARRLERSHHAVIVVAEGAGQHLIADAANKVKDASGNVLHKDIGLFLKERIAEYLKKEKIDHAIRYFDPSYLVRGIPAEGTDAVFCLHLAENAVHAAMSGRTDMVVGHWHGRFTHVPIALATARRRTIDTKGQLWQSLLGATVTDYLKIES